MNDLGKIQQAHERIKQADGKEINRNEGKKGLF